MQYWKTKAVITIFEWDNGDANNHSIYETTTRIGYSSVEAMLKMINKTEKVSDEYSNQMGTLPQWHTNEKKLTKLYLQFVDERTRDMIRIFFCITMMEAIDTEDNTEYYKLTNDQKNAARKTDDKIRKYKT